MRKMWGKVLVGASVFGALLILLSFQGYLPLEYGYALTLELEADGKTYSARSTYSCTFAGEVQQKGISSDVNLLIYRGGGEPLAVRLDDGRVIAIQFNPTFNFCELNDGGRLWGWRGVPELTFKDDDRRGYKLVESGYVDKHHMQEAEVVVDAAFEEKRSVDLLATRKMLFQLWVFDSAEDPSILRHVDWRDPEIALGDSVRLKRILIEPTRETPTGNLRKEFPWAASQSSNRWLGWTVRIGEAPELKEGMLPLPGDQLDGAPRFYSALKPGTRCEDAVPLGPLPPKIARHAGQFIVPRIDVPNNRVNLDWAGPSEDVVLAIGDFARLDKLQIQEKTRGSANWQLWNPQFCVEDRGCFQLGPTEHHGDGYPFSWSLPAWRFHNIGDSRCVWDKKTNWIYRVFLSARTW